MIELLSPVGDFECLKAAVQSGADSVYFGGQLFNARTSASNFDEEGLKNAIRYAKLRNVKINFTLNTLLKDDEFEDAAKLANYVYTLGADAIIVQDLGFAKYLINKYPDMDIHASTQITAHNLQGVIALQNLGFKRVVLSRELSLSEIEYICHNSNVEIETFIHGALCISYSGQCLFSSTIGGRSGNRGRCAQPCRLPYELLKENINQDSNLLDNSNKNIFCNNIKNNFDTNLLNNNLANSQKICEQSNNYTVLDKGYLLSPRDLCGLEYIPDLIKAGVKCFKIEGRMKPPEYVSVVTKIYRKYIDLALSDKPYTVDENDIKSLMLVFNRGGFSKGNFSDEPNTSYVYKEKPNNIGLYIGNISNINNTKSLITLTTSESLKIGDNFSVEHEEHKYTVSELLKNNENIPNALPGDIITIGRVKGNLNLGDKVYKLSSNTLSKEVAEFSNKENKKIPLSCVMTVKKGLPITLDVLSMDTENGSYFSMASHKQIDIIPIDAISSPITAERISEQLNKTTDTPFEFKNIKIVLDDNTYIPKISAINELRREIVEDLENQAIKRFERNDIFDSNNNDSIPLNTNLDKNSILLNVESSTSENKFNIDNEITNSTNTLNENNSSILKNENSLNNRPISLLLNEINLDFDYSKLDYKLLNNIYIPLKFFLNKSYHDIIKMISQNSKLYIYLPTIKKDNFRNIFFNNIDDYIKDFSVKGIVISNISGIEFMVKYANKLDIVSNYTLNVFNTHTIEELKSLGINRVMLSPELDKKTLQDLAKNSSLSTEFMVYGKLPVMNTGYCLLGSSNKCYPTCSLGCRESAKYYLKDRLGYKFRIIPDNLQTITTIYNSKITSIKYSDIPISNLLVSILDEDIDSICNILKNVKLDEPFSGADFTNGNLNKFV